MYKDYQGQIGNTDKDVLKTAMETKVLKQKITFFFTYSCI
jgi:hypothetical protein